MICELRQEIAGLRTAALEGDLIAEDEFRHNYGEMTERLVRRVLRRRQAATDFEYSILQAAEEVERESPCDRRELAKAVTERILDELLDAHAGSLESHRASSRLGALETVAGF